MAQHPGIVKRALFRLTPVSATLWLLRIAACAVVVAGVAGAIHKNEYSAAQWFDLCIFGLTTGSIYALTALGYTMVYGVLRLINFAHGDIMMTGAFSGYFVASHFAETGLLDIRLTSGHSRYSTVDCALTLDALQFLVFLHDVRCDVFTAERITEDCLSTLIDLLTWDTVQPLLRSALKCAFMSARLMLRMFRGPSGGGSSFGWVNRRARLCISSDLTHKCPSVSSRGRESED